MSINESCATFFLKALFEAFKEANLPKKPDKLDTWFKTRLKKKDISVFEGISALWPQYSGQLELARNCLLKAWESFGCVKVDTKLTWDYSQCRKLLSSVLPNITSISMLVQVYKPLSGGSIPGVSPSKPIPQGWSTLMTQSCSDKDGLEWLNTETKAWALHAFNIIQSQNPPVRWYPSEIEASYEDWFQHARPPGVPSYVSLPQYVAAIVARMREVPQLSYCTDSAQRGYFTSSVCNSSSKPSPTYNAAGLVSSPQSATRVYAPAGGTGLTSASPGQASKPSPPTPTSSWPSPIQATPLQPGVLRPAFSTPALPGSVGRPDGTSPVPSSAAERARLMCMAGAVPSAPQPTYAQVSGL